MNEKFFLLINYHMPPSLQAASWFISMFYGAVLFVVIGLIFLALNPKRVLSRFLIGIIAITISGQIVDCVKKEFRKPRPAMYFKKDVLESNEKSVHKELIIRLNERICKLLEKGKNPEDCVVRRFYEFKDSGKHPTKGFWVVGRVYKWNSFPSGHAQAAFCAAVALGIFIRRRWAWVGGLIFATLVSLSRIINGVHFPVDVIAGGAIGATTGWLFLLVSKFFYPPAFGSWPRKSSDKNFRIAISAGEASADLYAGRLARKLKESFGDAEVYGIGSKNLQASGAKVIARSEELSVMGFTGLAKAFPKIWKIQWRMREEVESNPPKLFIPIDMPDFNLALAKHHRRFGSKILYFIPPQVWAWRTNRVQKIAERTNAVCVVLPFEKKFYEGKIPVYFVGHPIAEETKPELFDDDFHRTVGNTSRAPIFALAPGSRSQEIRYVLKPMLEAACKIASEFSDLLFVIPLAPTLNKNLLSPYISDFPELKDRLVIFEGQVKEVFSRAKFGLICSGTATLEAALCRLPHIIAYRAGKINFAIAKRLARVKWIGLPNLIAQKTVVPELIQNDATPEKMANSALEYLSSERLYNEMKAELERVAQMIAVEDVYENVINVAKELIKDV